MAGEYGIPSTLDTAVLNTSLADYQKRLVDNRYNEPIIERQCNRSETKRMINGGLSIVESLIKDKQTDGGFYLGADLLNTTQGNTIATVEFKWQNAYEPIQITRDEERQNSGEAHKILDLVATKTKLANKAIKDRLDQAFTTPVSAANNLQDLETIVNTGTLGTIAGATDTFWQSTVTVSGSFVTQGLTDMATATWAVSASSENDSPTIYITTKAVFQKYWNTRLPLERIANAEMTANAGAKNLTFMGTPIIYGNYVGSGLMFGLNMNYIYLAVDSETDYITTPFIAPTNQTVKVAFVMWRGQLYTNNRRRQFKLTTIS
jgi:hypothetical protein